MLQRQTRLSTESFVKRPVLVNRDARRLDGAMMEACEQRYYSSVCRF